MRWETLKDGIVSLTDTSSPTFKGFPDNILDAANNWVQVFKDYMDGSPLTGDSFIPGSDTLFLGFEALYAGLIQISGGNGKVVFAQSIMQLSSAIVPGISTKSDGLFTGIAPIGLQLLELPTIFELGEQNLLTADQIAERVAKAIDAWLKTGTYINNESGATLLWQ